MITDKQKLFIKLLYEDKIETVSEMARVVGTHRSTLWRWLNKDEVVTYGKRYFARRNRKQEEKYFDEICKAKGEDLTYDEALKTLDLYGDILLKR